MQKIMLALWTACIAFAGIAAAAPMPDVNSDGKVNVMDLIAVRNALGKDPAQADAAADVNGDAKINILDLLAVRNSLGAELFSGLTDFPAVTATLDDTAGLSATPLPVALSTDYFPLQVGNYWEYEVYRWGGVVDRYRVEVTGKAYSYHYFSFYRLTNYFPHSAPVSRLVCRTYSNNVYEWPAAARSLNLWYMLGASIGTEWRLVLEGGEPCYSPLSATVESRSDKVSVPAGEFAGCIKVVYGHGCSDADPEAEWFAPGAGLIKRVETTFAGPMETVLVRACVDGEIIPGLHLLDGFGALAKSDAPSYTNNLMPPGRILPVMQATLVVFNYGPEAVTFNFNTSQRFDFIIGTPDGATLYRWSADKAFLQVLGSEKLFNGKLIYTEKILLQDWRSASPVPVPLPDGLYTLEAVLTSNDRPMSGKTTFEIRSVH